MVKQRNNRTRRRRGGSIWSPFNLVRKYREHREDRRNGLKLGTTRRQRKEWQNSFKGDAYKASMKDISDKAIRELSKNDFNEKDEIKNSPSSPSTKHRRDAARNHLAYSKGLENTVRKKSWYNPF